MDRIPAPQDVIAERSDHEMTIMNRGFETERSLMRTQTQSGRRQADQTSETVTGRRRRTAPMVALLVVMACPLACNTVSGPDSSPNTQQETSPEFANIRLRDIAVTAIKGSVFDREDEVLPLRSEMREQFRRYLIDAKSYAVPRSSWVDERYGRDDGAELEADAVLGVTINQWVTEGLAARGVAYAGGKFELRSIDGNDLLWQFACRDLPVYIDRARLSGHVTDRVRDAVRVFAARALGTIPTHLTGDPPRLGGTSRVDGGR